MKVLYNSQELFTEYDVDGDGFIDFDEVLSGKFDNLKIHILVFLFGAQLSYR